MGLRDRADRIRMSSLVRQLVDLLHSKDLINGRLSSHRVWDGVPR